MSTSDICATEENRRIDAFIWEVITVAFRSLDQVNGSAPAEITLRVLKIAEEFGEAVQAWIGVTGQNPRKGVTHTWQEVAGELGDVAVTALVAAASLGFEPRRVLAGTAAKVAARFTVPGSESNIGLPPDPATDGEDEDHRLDAFIWAWVSADFRPLDKRTGSDQDEITLRLVKIAEEFGEAAQAWIGVIGQNPRKGVTHTRQQVADELGDIALGALVTVTTMGFDPRLVLAGTATKLAARFGIPVPRLPGELGQPAPPDRSTQPSCAASSRPEDLFTTLIEIADAQTRRFPHHNSPFARVTRLAEETGELAQQVNHAENTGVKTAKHGPFDPAALAAEVADVLLAATGIAAHYDIADQVRALLAARHARYRDRGLLPAAPTESQPTAAEARRDDPVPG